MKLLELTTDELVDAEILTFSKKDFEDVMGNQQFEFNWSLEKGNEVYKLILISGKNQVLGIVSLVDLPKEFRIHLNLLEVSKKNQGKNKMYDHIAGCLIAHSAELAFMKGYYGFVSLEPKTQLVELYQEKYGFDKYGIYLAIDGISSQNLITKYLENE